jgi:hypothetical protein
MVPEWILKLLDGLIYYLVCKVSGHHPEPWYPTGIPDTQARLCSRCLRAQRSVLGVNGPWEK